MEVFSPIIVKKMRISFFIIFFLLAIPKRNKISLTRKISIKYPKVWISVYLIQSSCIVIIFKKYPYSGARSATANAGIIVEKSIWAA